MIDITDSNRHDLLSFLMCGLCVTVNKVKYEACWACVVGQT